MLSQAPAKSYLHSLKCPNSIIFNRNIFMTLRTELYHAISEKLLECPEIKWVDVDSGQLENPQQDYPMPLPAVLIDIGPIEYTDISDSVKEAEATEISLSLIHPLPGNHFSTGHQRSAASDWLKLNSRLASLIDGLESSAFAPLSLLKEAPLVNENRQHAYEFIFQTRASINWE